MWQTFTSGPWTWQLHVKFSLDVEIALCRETIHWVIKTMRTAVSRCGAREPFGWIPIISYYLFYSTFFIRPNYEVTDNAVIVGCDNEHVLALVPSSFAEGRSEECWTLIAVVNYHITVTSLPLSYRVISLCSNSSHMS